jgi:hypothetical protein
VANKDDGKDSENDGKDKEKDSGRGLEFLWINVEGGVQHLGLQTLSSKGSLVPGIVKTSELGPMTGLGVGVRLFFLTLGLRGRIGIYDEYNYVSLNPEVGLHFKITDNVEFALSLSGGYSALGGFKANNLLDSSVVNVRGFNVRAGLNLDYYFSHFFSLGVMGTAEVLAMTRPGVSVSSIKDASANTNTNISTSQDAAAAEAQLQQQAALVEGSGVGVAFTGSMVFGVHF